MDRKERRGYYEGRMEKYSRQYMDQGCDDEYYRDERYESLDDYIDRL